MAREKKVVDAAVIAKWFLNEEDSSKAVQLRDDHIAGKVLLIAPDLVFIEVMNTLRCKMKDKNGLHEANKALWDAQLKVEKISEFLLEKALDIALKHELTIYDGIYAATASIFGVPLVTTDKQLLKVPNAEML